MRDVKYVWVDKGESWKYSSVSYYAGRDDVEVRIYIDDNGLIDNSTYSDTYLKENGLGKYAVKEESDQQEPVAQKKTKEKKKSSFKRKLLLAPLKLIWWLIKFLLKLIGLSFLISLFSDNSNDEN